MLLQSGDVIESLDVENYVYKTRTFNKMLSLMILDVNRDW